MKHEVRVGAEPIRLRTERTYRSHLTPECNVLDRKDDTTLKRETLMGRY
jgi:hypothetical protein